MKATGKVERGWIGARIQPVTDDIAESVGLDKSRGAMIAAIDPGSPAVPARLQPGDVILSYDGKPIERSRQLPRLVADTPPDKLVKVTIWRDGKEYEVELKVAITRTVPPERMDIPTATTASQAVRNTGGTVPFDTITRRGRRRELWRKMAAQAYRRTRSSLLDRESD